MEASTAKTPKIPAHARSLPTKRPYEMAVFFSVVHYLAVIATVTAFVAFFMEPSSLAVRFILGGLGLSSVTWLVAYLKRRVTFCPLCKGTPLANSGARTHKRALRVFPFNHGMTAVFSILATRTFRCMYCGSDYDLLRTPSRRLLRGKVADAIANKSPVK